MSTIDKAAKVLAKHRRLSVYRADCTCGAFFTASPSLDAMQRDFEAHVTQALADAGLLASDAVRAEPLVTADVEAMRTALCDCGHLAAPWHGPENGCRWHGIGPNRCPCRLDWPEALIASGAVTPVAALADDEAVWNAVCAAIGPIADKNMPGWDAGEMTTAALRALAAVLSQPREES
jgi:hypothetical protein